MEKKTPQQEHDEQIKWQKQVIREELLEMEAESNESTGN